MVLRLRNLQFIPLPTVLSNIGGPISLPTRTPTSHSPNRLAHGLRKKKRKLKSSSSAFSKCHISVGLPSICL